MPLQRAALACHIALIGTLAAAILVEPTRLALVIAPLVLLPLLIAIRGVATSNRTSLQRLAVLLVAYVGGVSVEVVARSGQAPLFSVALLVAVVELGLLIALIRRQAARG